MVSLTVKNRIASPIKTITYSIKCIIQHISTVDIAVLAFTEVEHVTDLIDIQFYENSIEVNILSRGTT